MTHLILILSCYVHWVLESGCIEAIKLIYCKLHLSMDSSQLGFFCISFPLVTFYAAATPKQIRELMKVDGLTNDEVKSHLQVGFESRSWITTILSNEFLLLQYFATMVKEVLVFLQKYRLHTRRPPTSAPATSNQEVVVMGGMRELWVPNVHYQVSKQSMPSQSGSPQGPLQLSGTSRGISTTGGESGEDEDGKSESNSWKSHLGSGEEETE